MKRALDVHRVLLEADVPHEMARLRRPVTTADELPHVLGVPAEMCAVVRCYIASHRDAQQVVAVLVSAGATPDPGCLLAALDVDVVRPAGADETSVVTDFAAGLVSPLPLPEDVLLLADAGLEAHDVLYIATGESGVALGIRTRDVLVAAGARVTMLTDPGAAAPIDVAAYEATLGSGRLSVRVAPVA